MRFTSTLMALVACGAWTAQAAAQDSVSKLQALPGDAVNAHTAAEQINDYVVDQTIVNGSWGTVFGIAPLIKNSAERALSPTFFTGLGSAQAISRTTKSNVPFARTSYMAWNGQGFGVNNDLAKNNPGVNVNTTGFQGFQFGVGASEFSSGPGGESLNSVLGAVVNFQSTRPSRLYVSRVAAAQNGNSDTCNVSQFGVGGIDDAGNLHFRADASGSSACGGFTPFPASDENYFRVQLLSRGGASLNVISNAGGSDAGATQRVLNNQTTTHNTPTLIPSAVAGRPVLIGANQAIQYVYEQTAFPAAPVSVGTHLAAGQTDHRGNVSYSPQNFTTLLGPSTAGTAALLSKSAGGGGVSDSLNFWGLDNNGNVTGKLARTIPAPGGITDPVQAWNSGIVAGTQEFDHYHSQVAFRGGNGQVAVGTDQAGRMIAAATVYYGLAGADLQALNNYIAVARTTTTGTTTWSVAAWTQETLSPLVSDGKTIFQNGTTPIGRLTAQLFGPPISAPMIDSVGNIYFLSSIQLDGTPAVQTVGLLRAVYDPATFGYKLELVFKQGDVFQGVNSATPYQIDFLTIADSNSVSSGGVWSDNIAAGAFANLNPSSLSITDSRTLGGLVVQASIVYNVDGDGDFDAHSANPASPDEDYNVILYLSSAVDCNDNGVPDDQDIVAGTSNDVNTNGIPDECESIAPGVSYCFGDGTLPTACPCVPPNTVPNPPAAPGHGCANSLNLNGAQLSATGTVSPDTLTFSVDVAPLYIGFGFLIKGNQNQPNGLAASDGIRCASGQLVRFGGHNAGSNGNPQGFWIYPNTAQTTPVSVATAQPPAQLAYYQLFYRNAAANFCTTATANFSNGYQISWP